MTTDYGLRTLRMRFPQVLIYENDGRIAELLRKEGKLRQWSLREPRRPESCLRLLERGSPTVLVLKVGTDLVQELTLLERVSWLFPDATTVVVGDAADAVLAGLAWDLGATLVLFPPQPRHYLIEILGRLLEPPIAGPPRLEQDDNPVSQLPDLDR
jgi:DNA-binding NtrC family response regulator